MKIKIISLALVISILMVGCNTIPQSTNNPNESTISVNGTGNASASPDLVDIQLAQIWLISNWVLTRSTRILTKLSVRIPLI
jgi:hypothetical protein